MAQALAEVKRDLGRDAVILHTRNVRKGGLLGLLGGKCCWEVTAVPHADVPSRAEVSPQTAGRYVGDELGAARRGGKNAVALASHVADRPKRRAVLGDDDIHSILTGGLGLAVARPNVAAAVEYQPPVLTRSELNVLALKPGADVPVELLPPADGVTVQDTTRRDTTIRDMAAPKPPAASLNLSPRMDTSPRAGAQASVVVKGGSRLAIAAPAHASPTEQADAVSQQASAPAAPSVVVSPAVKPWPREFLEFHSHLLRQDVEERIADELMHELSLSLAGTHADAKEIADRLCDLIAARIPTATAAPRKPARTGPRVIALAGPTGVGKTTTIAKLAADFKLRQRQRVGLVTMDTYRIAAVDQLRVYAEIIEVPLKTVLSAGEMHQAVYGMDDVDVVLIDSAGRSQNDQPRLNELKAFLTAADADEVHLVVSATASKRTMATTLHRFSAMAPNRMILTKLDEAETFGTILSFPTIGAAPLAFTTMGQDVPDDIEPADPWKLAQRVMRGAGV